METIFSNANVIPQFINEMEAAQQKPKQEKLAIYDEYMHAVALKLLLQSGEYKTEIRGWSKLPDNQQTWTAWKANFREAYVAKRRTKAAGEGEGKPFGGSVVFGASVEKKTNEQLRRQVNTTSAEPAPLTNHMMDLLEG